MSPASPTRRLAIPVLVALLLATLLPATVLAADPVATDDGYTVGVSSGNTILDVLDNDTDADPGDDPTIVSATDPANGTTILNGGVLRYRPDTGFHGTDTFDYTIEDEAATQDTATVTVIVNDPPLAVDDPAGNCPVTNGSLPIPEDWLETGPFGEWFTFTGDCELLANDTDPNGDPLTYEIVDGPTHGDLFPDPSITAYKPDPNFSTAEGDWVSDSFTYRAFDGLSYSEEATVRLWIAPVNDPPTLTPGGDVTVAEDVGIYTAPWATDVSAGPNESTQVVSSEIVSGSGVAWDCPAGPLLQEVPSIEADGDLTFVVFPDCYGTYHVTLRIKDNGGTSPDYSFGSLTPNPDDTGDTISFDVIVTPDGVEAHEDVAAIPEDPDPAAWPIDVLANDAHDVGATITAVTQGAKGQVTIAPDGLSVSYDPASNATGSDSFTYTLSDGLGGADKATVSVTIGTSNDDPVAADDALTVAEDAGATPVDVLDNDDDAEGDPLTIVNKTNGTKGVVAITGGGTGLTYDPNPNATGTDSFTYTIQDGQGGTANATVDVTITPSNDLPLALNDAAFTVPQGAAATALAVMGNDSDIDGDALTIIETTNGAHGSVAITGGGTGLTYDPTALYFGTDVFTYKVSDGHGGTDTATVLLTVVKDTVKPTVIGPAESFYAQTVAPLTTRVKISWSGSDPGGTGIAKFDLQVSVNGGAFSTVALASPTATSINRTQTDERSYRYRVRATDHQGNVSAWVNGPAFKPGRVQNTSSSVIYTGPWATVSTASALGGSHRYASSLSARAKLTRTVRDFAIVATKAPGSGLAQVWIDGVQVATINLGAAVTTYRQVVFSRHFSTLGTHTIEIRPAGGGRVYLDAFLVMR